MYSRGASIVIGFSILSLSLVFNLACSRQRSYEKSAVVTEGETVSSESSLPASESTPSMPVAKEVHGRWAGSKSCNECHTEKYTAFVQTSHHDSMRPISCEGGKTVHSVTHPLSNRIYRVFEDEAGVTCHLEEIRIDENGQSFPLNQKVIDWVIGSGAVARAFIAEEDSAWLQSPIAYYASSRRFDMSQDMINEIILALPGR